ncbi:MAG: hypothetical protein VKP62_14950 [Candidatus Sericytochromatia bacterium]|nr:hypothetical protein [Candidatus Sericytochromatia bacterium]
MAGMWCQNDVAKSLALAILCATWVAGCGRPTPNFGSQTALSDKAAPAAPRNPIVNEVYQETQPEMAESDPVEGPVNLPPIPKASSTPVEPASLQVRALASTHTLMPAPSMGNLKATVIRARVTWTPVKGAGAYRIYSLASREGQASGDKGKLCYYLPQWMPVAIVGGGMGGLGNLNVGQEYVFTVEALDRAGNVIAAGQDNCAPLSPLDVPYLREPGQGASQVGQTPYFKWTPSRGADGYYVEVFKTVRGVLPSLPMWRGFRTDTDASVMMYGQQMDVFEGTRPMQWSVPLNVGTRYTWTVCAVRTDTHNMHNAKAIAKAIAPLGYFVP